MKRIYIPKKFHSKSRMLIHTMNSILDDYSSQGYDLSLRQLYYRLVAKNTIQNSDKSYANLSDLVTDARLAGEMDWNVIVDRGRPTIANPHWDSPEDMVASVAEQYKIDMWENQDWHVEVMVEKQALEGILIPVCKRWDVNFTANKGYSSTTSMFEIGTRIANYVDAGKAILIIHLGDHDPSGIDMTRDIQERICLFAECSPETLPVRRAALNIDQIKQYEPPPNPAKLSDSRAAGYIAEFGRDCWELDALEPAVLEDILTKIIKSHIDEQRWNQKIAERNKGRERIREIASQM